MKNKFVALLLLYLVSFCQFSALAVNGGEDIDETIENLYYELRNSQNLADVEMQMLQKSRQEYWAHIGELQNEMDKARLVLYSQNGESLFSTGLASSALDKVSIRFNDEKTPFENWLQSMSATTSRHEQTRYALKMIHTEQLSAKTKEYIRKSIAICDSLDAKFASLRDSIAIDRQRYERLSAEIQALEDINSEVVDKISRQVFQGKEGSFLSLFTSADYSNIDFFYDSSRQLAEEKPENDSSAQRINRWEDTIFMISVIMAISLGIALRFILAKKPEYRSKRWYYAFLLFVAMMIMGSFILSNVIGLDSLSLHNEGVFLNNYLFMFFMVLSATLRLKRPGLGWSVASYAPLMALNSILITFAFSMPRDMSLKIAMPVIFFFVAIWAIITIFIGYRRIPKADYLASLSSLSLILIPTVLVFMGYYFPSLMLVLYCVSVMTYISALVCIKYFLNSRIRRAGPIMRLSLSYLIYPYFYIFVLVKSLYNVADVFNLSSWLQNLFATPFVSSPHFGVISVERILLLILVGIMVNYVIKLVKLTLMRLDTNKYVTGVHAVAITLGTLIVWFGYGVFTLLVLQINHSGVIAAIGGASLGIGFAMKETFENLISGLQLMASRARPGDLVECDGSRGVLRHIGILSTQLQLEDGPIVSFPNRQLFGSTFTNLSLNQRREIRHIVFDISADSDLQLAKSLMLKASNEIDGVVDHDKHYVVMRQTNSGIVRLDYKCWIDSAMYLRAEPAVREAIFRAFRAHGIKIADFSNELGLHFNRTITN